MMDVFAAIITQNGHAYEDDQADRRELVSRTAP